MLRKVVLLPVCYPIVGECAEECSPLTTRFTVGLGMPGLRRHMSLF